jgi:hypothetical protein
MTNANRKVREVKEDDTPELKVLGAINGANRKTSLSAPLIVPSRNYTRPPRPELAVLGWESRAIRLAIKQ